MSLRSETSGRLIAGILAGGGSRRFGSDKAQALWNGKSLLDWAIGNTLCITDNINILTKNPSDYSNSGCRIIKDHYNISTPISGILSIEPYVKEWLLLLACDIPFFEKDVLEYLWKMKDSEKAVLIRVEGRYQPFLGLYPAKVLHLWREAFENKEYHLQRIVERMPRIVIEQSDLLFAGISLRSFQNINTPADLERISM